MLFPRSFLLLFALFCTVLGQLQAQQLPLFTQYREMQGIINPAAISMDFINYKQPNWVGLTYRRQWVDMDNAPATAAAHYERLQEVAGAHLVSGTYLSDDRLGKESMMGVYQRIGFLISSDPSQMGLSIGLSSGMINYRIRVTETSARDIDPLLQNGDRKKWFPDFGAGVFGYTKIGDLDDLLYGGFSVPQIFGLKTPIFGDSFQVTRYQHYYLNAGYFKSFNDEGSALEFSTWVKYVPRVKPNIDVNCRVRLKNTFHVGVGWNTNKTLSIEAGVFLGEQIGFDAGLFRVGYSYSINYGSVANYFGNSHEIHLATAFGGSRY
jgi:type IX secretion system PorP/SprF family membrane protein